LLSLKSKPPVTLYSNFTGTYTIVPLQVVHAR
jgi:hypothetical protein